MIVVLADDFTGAAEIAGMGHRYGLRAAVAFDAALQEEADLVVIDTNTRSGTRNNAIGTIRSMAGQISAISPHHMRLFKKADSVLRGHVVAEMETLMEEGGYSSGLLVAGNPASGRLIDAGVLSINGVPVDHTDFTSDPEYPLTSSCVMDLLGLSRVALTSANPGASLSGGITVANMRNREDLLAWAKAITPTTLAAGGAAFFEALLQVWGCSVETQSKPFVIEEKTLVVCGSACEASRAAVDRWERTGIGVVRMPAALFDHNDPHGITAWSHQACDLLRVQDVAVLAFAAPPPSYSMTSVQQGSRDGVGQTERLAALMGETAINVVAETQPAHLLIEGGSTASALLRRSAWAPFIVVDEHAPGVVTLRSAHAMAPLVTVKPGSYLWPQMLLPSPHLTDNGQ